MHLPETLAQFLGTGNGRLDQQVNFAHFIRIGPRPKMLHLRYLLHQTNIPGYSRALMAVLWLIYPRNHGQHLSMTSRPTGSNSSHSLNSFGGWFRSIWIAVASPSAGLLVNRQEGQRLTQTLDPPWPIGAASLRKANRPSQNAQPAKRHRAISVYIWLSCCKVVAVVLSIAFSSRPCHNLNDNFVPEFVHV